jgi:hypothetical protein
MLNFELQMRSKISDSVDEAVREYTFREMEIIHRRWRYNLRKRFITEHPEWRPWEHGEPVTEAQWANFLAINDTQEARVKLFLITFY